MRRNRSQNGAWGLGGLLCALLPACTNDLSQLYCNPEEEPCGPEGSGGSDTGTGGAGPDAPLSLPFRPKAEAVEACEKCSIGSCAELQYFCSEIEVCREQMDCLSKCSDPACWENCRAKFGQNEWSNWGFTNILEGLLFCTASSCPSTCQTGDNWTCVGHYDFSDPEPRTVEVYVRFGTGSVPYGVYGGPGHFDALAGATVEACYGGILDRRFCDDLDEAVPLDASNGAHLTLDASLGPVDAYFELLPARPTVLTANHRIYSPPFTADGTMQPFYDPAEVLGRDGLIPSPGTATLVVMKTDCNGLGSKSAGKIVLREQWEEEVLEETRDLATEAVSIFPLELAEERMVTVEFFLAGEEQPAATRDVLITPGWATHVALQPRAF